MLALIDLTCQYSPLCELTVGQGLAFLGMISTMPSIEFSIMAKHFDRQGKPPYAYHAASFLILANMNYETAMLLCIDSFSRIICNFYINSLLLFPAMHVTPPIPWPT
jgi:hypothetical protein